MKEWAKDWKSEPRGHSQLRSSLITLRKDAAGDAHGRDHHGEVKVTQET